MTALPLPEQCLGRHAEGWLSTAIGVGKFANMVHRAKAELLLDERLQLTQSVFAEMVVWRVPVRVAGSGHDFKYRLALVDSGRCVLRYDNEAGKGDHKHLGDDEVDYAFRDLDQLQADFWDDVERRLKR